MFSNSQLRGLILPFFLEQLLNMTVGVADTFMVSFAGDAAVSGVSLVNMLAVFFLYVFTALASGGAVVVSQYIGGKNGRGAEHSAGQLLMISTMVSALCSAAILTWNREILQLLFGRAEKSVMQACMTYQRISAYSFAALGIYNAGAAVCRSEGKTSVTLKIAVFSNIVNVAGNALGIFVFRAGVAGVAWPTVIARVFSAVAVTCFCLRPGNGVRYTKSDVFSYDSAAVKKILHIAVPNSVENGAFQLIKVALSSITAMFGTAQITANGIAQSLWSLAALVVMTMGPVYITVIGQCMGAGDVQDAERYFRKLTRITLLCAVAWNSLILALTPLAMRFYPLSGEIRRMVIELVLIHNVFNALVWPFGGALPNGLRAAGDVKYTMKVAVLSTVCVRLALSVVLSVWMRMGVFGIAWAMVCDWIVRGGGICNPLSSRPMEDHAGHLNWRGSSKQGKIDKEGGNMSEIKLSAKKLGFGLMRLPKNGEAIDIEQVKKMVDLFMAAGFTYFDTAWAYPGSEDAIRQALVERYPREKFTLATKNAAWNNCASREDAVGQFETSLKRTGAGYFDFYLLHNLGEGRTHFFDDFDMWSFVQEKKAEGKIRHAGFSFHSTPEELDAILKAHPEAEFVQLQINYADWENSHIQSRACYETARKHGKPVVIMEPVKGGLLASPPEAVERVFKSADTQASCASWAIRFAASLDGVIAVLSGMSSVEQMKDNLSYMTDFKPLTEAEQRVVSKARETLDALPMIPCTSCNYCAEVCPKNIGISGSFTALNLLNIYGNYTYAEGQEKWLVTRHGKARADECIHCGSCEQVCPQHIAIRSNLVKVAEAFHMA